MNEITLAQLSEIDEKQIIDLMNNEEVGKQLPLLTKVFTSEDCRAFLETKKKLWDEHGYGPWAIVIKGEFAGWGGLQPEQGEADFALVLHPKFWGWGRKIFNQVRDIAFTRMNLTSIMVLLPPSRPNSNAITRLGFFEDGQLDVNGEVFKKFRLNKSNEKPAPDRYSSS